MPYSLNAFLIDSCFKRFYAIFLWLSVQFVTLLLQYWTYLSTQAIFFCSTAPCFKIAFFRLIIAYYNNPWDVFDPPISEGRMGIYQEYNDLLDPHFLFKCRAVTSRVSCCDVTSDADTWRVEMLRSTYVVFIKLSHVASVTVFREQSTIL